MQRRLPLLATLLLATVLLARTDAAFADTPETLRAWSTEVGLFGGYKLSGKGLQLGNSLNPNDTPDNSAIFGLRLGLNLTEHIAVEGEAGYARSKWRSDGLPTDVIGWRGSVLYHFLTGAFRPFVRGGIGAESLLNTKIGIERDSDAASVWGVGAKYDLFRELAVRFDALLVNTAGQHSTINRGSMMEQNYEFLLGLSWAFGLSEPPPPPPPPPPPVQLPPPVTDTDGDGLLDNVDKCPNEAEDKDGFQDDDGCPDPDNDGDGILDAQDKCPNEAEDKDGFEDEDGCPDPDNDHDGICDPWVARKGLSAKYANICKGSDQCSEEPETKNNYQDDDGCPDEVPAAVAKAFKGALEGIEFETGKATIRKMSFKVLDKAFAVLDEYKDVKVEISGHTDDRGDAERNKKLSQDRAESVKKYLVDKGIAAERLSAVGFGAEKPIADNKTAKGQTKNRRIEFRLM